MKKAVVINSLLDGDQWAQKIGSMDVISVVLEKARSLSKDVFIVLDNDAGKIIGSVGTAGRISVHDRIARNVFSKMYDALRSYEYFIYFFFDTPLIDVDLTRKMEETHNQEIAEYTYGEGFPVGFTPEILRTDILQRLVVLLEKDDGSIARDSIFTAVSKDINSFDIETYFAHRNLRLKRLELTTSEKRNRLLVGRVVERADVSCSFDTFCSILDESPAIVRTFPAYAEIEITGKTNGRCVYSPSTKRGPGEMAVDEYTSVLDTILGFTDEIHVSISFLGEAFLHPNILDIIGLSLKRKNLHLIVETDGLKCTPDVADHIAAFETDNLSVIFRVDAVEERTYTMIREGELGRAERNIRYLLSKTMRNIYVQLVRMDNNEDEMLKFFDIWEAEGAKVIIQKYNSFLGLLPALSSSDLTPLERTPCWHLQRDIVVFSNGDVPRCRQDVNGQIILGNLLRDDVADIWKGGERYFIDHCRARYDESCTVCDEYYTFNF